MLTEQLNLAASCLMILLIFHHSVSRVMGANSRLPLLVNPQTLRPAEYVTITGALSIARFTDKLLFVLAKCYSYKYTR